MYLKDLSKKIKRIKEIGKLDYIDRNIIQELIDKIYVREDRSINVVFKYKNLYEDALRYLNN
jgi:ABC-type phosphate transport system ATPase subunit